jgi:hypothetical protein
VIKFYGFVMSIASPTELSLRCCMRVKPQMSFNTDVMINFASKKLRDDIIIKCFKFIQDIKNTAYEDKLKRAENFEMCSEVFDDRRFSNELLDFRSFSLSSINSNQILYFNPNSRIHWGFGDCQPSSA